MIKALVFLLVFSLNAYAMSPVIIGGGTHESGAGCSDKFSWHMEDASDPTDVTVGSPAGCSDGDETGSLTGVVAFSAAQKTDGTTSILIDGTSEYYAFTVASGDIAHVDDIKVTWDIYVDTLGSGGNNYAAFIWITIDGDDNIKFKLATDTGKIRVENEVNNTSYNVETPTAVDLDTWLSCEYQGKASTAGNDNYLICTGESADEDDDDFGAKPGGTSGTLRVGNYLGTATGSVYYIDNMQINASDRF